MKQLTRITALSFVTFCLLILQGCSQKSTTESSQSPTESSTTVNASNSAPQKAKAKRPAPDFTVTATDLAKEFGLDRETGIADYEKAAKESKKIAEKYADKEVAVSGRILDVNTARTPMRLSLKAGDEVQGVSGDFDEEERASLCPLKEDQKVTMQCLGGSDRLKSVIGQPDLKRCALVNAE
jgi:tRNA_anti-like